LKRTKFGGSTTFFSAIPFFYLFFRFLFASICTMDLFLCISVFLSAIALVSSRPMEKENEEFAKETNQMDEEVNRMDGKAIDMAGEGLKMDNVANRMEEEANEMDEEAIDMDKEANKIAQREDFERQAFFGKWLKDNTGIDVKEAVDTAVDAGKKGFKGLVDVGTNALGSVAKNSPVGAVLGEDMVEMGMNGLNSGGKALIDMGGEAIKNGIKDSDTDSESDSDTKLDSDSEKKSDSDKKSDQDSGVGGKISSFFSSLGDLGV